MCSDCADTGWYRLDVEIGHPQFGKMIRCGCKAREDAQRLNRISGLDDTERMITLDEIVTDGLPSTARMVQECKKFIANPKIILTIYGRPGNGKTKALKACINAMLDQNIQAVYVNAFDLIGCVQSAFSSNTQTKEFNIVDGNAYERLKQFERVKVLAIDEFEKVKRSEWVINQLTDLIGNRYNMAEAGSGGTIIAMNEIPYDLPDWIVSRIKRYPIIHNTDDDMRPALAQYERELFDDPNSAFETGERPG